MNSPVTLMKTTVVAPPICLTPSLKARTICHKQEEELADHEMPKMQGRQRF
jgi:hypothetical protein